MAKGLFEDWSVPAVTRGKKAIWKAALVAPLGAPLFMVLAAALELVASGGLEGLHKAQFLLLFIFSVGLLISYGVMLILGLPYLLWLRSRGWLTWLTVCAGAAVVGAISWAGLSYSSPPSWSVVDTLGALMGLAAGALFSVTAKLPMK